MSELDFQPKMIGREDELNQLQTYLDRASEGKGGTVFISGEAGIGKTRLVNEIKDIARSKGFKTLTGYSLSESLSPFLPFIDALRSGGMESLFAEEAPRVEAVYLITHSGLLIKEVLRKETKLDPDIFSSLLTTIGEFVSQSLSKMLGENKEGTLNTLGYENYRILIESGKDINLAVIISGRENEFLINDMKEIINDIQNKFGTILADWGGEEGEVTGIEKHIQSPIKSGKYDGIYYGKTDPKARRNLLFENVSLGLARQAKTNPTLLCIEDLQWADPSSLALMHYIGRNTNESGLLVLGTYRPEDVVTENEKSHPLIGTMQLMDREDLLKKIELARLPEKNMDDFLFAVLGKIDFSDEFKVRVYQETEGNPLFVIQLIKSLVEENIIKADNGTWKLAKPIKDIDIPSKIYNVIERRLNRLGKEDRKVLDYASVIGEMFNSSVLTSALNKNRTQLLEQLRGLEQTHRLIHSQNGNFKFDHAKIKEVLYNEIPRELRMDYHSIIANSIETLNKDNLDGVIGDLAFHYNQCKNKEKALLYLIKAAEKAKKDYSNEEAIRFYDKALGLEGDAEKRKEIYEVLGDIWQILGDYDRSIESYNNAIKLTKQRHKIADIKGKIGFIYERIGAYNETLRICREALNLVKGEDCDEEANALRLIGWSYLRLGNYSKALENFKMCLKIGQKINDDLTIGSAFEGIGGILEYQGKHDKALKLFNKALESLMEYGNLSYIGNEKFNIAFSLGQQGKYERALKWYGEGWEIAEKIGKQSIMAAISWGQAEVYYGKGDLNKALSNAHQAFKISTENSQSMIIGESYKMFGMIYGKQKKWEESIENFEQSFRIFKKIGLKKELGDAYYEFGLMWKDKGESGKAKEHLNKSLEIYDELKLEKRIEKVKVELENLS
jgi:predicted ATPase